MKIRCGSHQQNRSIVRPGLSLMAAKVALTAEEFRENSQRSIDLFNTEKLSTDSTRVLKSVYCNSVHFCRCNLHGACGGKEGSLKRRRKRRTVAICTERVEAKAKVKPYDKEYCVAICTERVEAKKAATNYKPYTTSCNLHGACGGKGAGSKEALEEEAVAICTERVEAKRKIVPYYCYVVPGCNLHGACGGKGVKRNASLSARHRCNLHGACGGKASGVIPPRPVSSLQSARSVWRQSSIVTGKSASA